MNAHTGYSQSAGDSITGVWKGTSLCQVKNSPCHDETAVYHISPSGKPGVYKMQMNKIVNGAEEEMGVTDFVYDRSKHSLTGITKDRQQREGVWKFIVKGGHISGTLVIDGNTLYRKIEVTKQ